MLHLTQQAAADRLMPPDAARFTKTPRAGHARRRRAMRVLSDSADMTLATFHLDHIVPRSAGGATELANLCLSCPLLQRVQRRAAAGA